MNYRTNERSHHIFQYYSIITIVSITNVFHAKTQLCKKNVHYADCKWTKKSTFHSFQKFICTFKLAYWHSFKPFCLNLGFIYSKIMIIIMIRQLVPEFNSNRLLCNFHYTSPVSFTFAFRKNLTAFIHAQLEKGFANYSTGLALISCLCHFLYLGKISVTLS